MRMMNTASLLSRSATDWVIFWLTSFRFSLNLLPILFRNGTVSLPLLVVPRVGREHDTGRPVQPLSEVPMIQDLLQDWQMLYANAVAEGESGHLATALEQAETAIKRRFEEESDTLSALEEAKLYSALRTLHRLKARL